MKVHILTKPGISGKQLQIISLAAILLTLFLPAQHLSAGSLNDCLIEKLNNADDSVTVGQLREQCRQKSSANTIAGKGPDGPAEIILKSDRSRKPAFFPHKKHQDKYSCGICHHGKNASGRLEKYTEETIIYNCTACHNADMANDELNSFQLIGHKLCRECHRKNQDITSATCSTCHRKDL